MISAHTDSPPKALSGLRRDGSGMFRVLGCFGDFWGLGYFRVFQGLAWFSIYHLGFRDVQGLDGFRDVQGLGMFRVQDGLGMFRVQMGLGWFRVQGSGMFRVQAGSKQGPLASSLWPRSLGDLRRAQRLVLNARVLGQHIHPLNASTLRSRSSSQYWRRSGAC